MFQTNIVQSLLKGLDPIHQKSISLGTGQIFNGRIIKLFPGQLASLQLGGVTLTAKLEAALTAGNRYWFQVQQSEGIPILKVLQPSAELGDFQSKPSHNFVQQLGITNTRLNEMVVNYLANEEIPFSKEHISQGAETLKTVGMANERGLSILQLLIQRNLPITPPTFSALHSVFEGANLSNQVHQLFDALQTIKIQEPLLQQLKSSIANIISAGNIKIDQHQVIELLTAFFIEAQHSQRYTNAQVELTKLGIINENTLPTQLLETFKDRITKINPDQLKNIWPTLTIDEVIAAINKNDLKMLFSKMVLGTGKEKKQTLQQFLSLFSKEIDVQHELPLAKQLSSMVSQIGYQYERDVNLSLQQQTVSSEKLLSQFKASLINARELELPSQIHDKIEAIVHRITGQQLLSINQEGPITNQAVVIPLNLFGRKTDLTIQWEGKRQKDEQLDANHCRILFYINLNELKETIIDVQIQNRIVSLHIINNHDKPVGLISVLQPLLKDALVDLNYKLSSVKWSQPKQQEAVNRKQNKFQPSNDFYRSQRPYQGVDIRV